MPRSRPRIAVVGCGRGELCIALALTVSDGVVAGFDADVDAVALARRSAARCRVADRTTFEVAPPGGVLGHGYEIVVLNPRPKLIR